MGLALWYDRDPPVWVTKIAKIRDLREPKGGCSSSVAAGFPCLKALSNTFPIGEHLNS